MVRRNPTPEDLEDVGVAVVDIGGEHDPARSNFDHHQFPREYVPTCALSLVLEHVRLSEEARQFFDWLEPAEWFDCRGPGKTADWLGVPRKTMSQLASPIDISLLRRFAQKTTLSAGDPIYEFMRFVGEDMLGYLRVARERIDFVGRHVRRWSIPSGDDTIEAIFLPRTDPLADEPSVAVSSFVRFKGLQNIAAIVYPDRRASGYGIARHEDHPRLDFSLIGTEPDVLFAHTSGFMCKTSATEETRLRALIAAAWR